MNNVIGIPFVVFAGEMWFDGSYFCFGEMGREENLSRILS